MSKMDLNNIDEKWLSDSLELVLTTQGIAQGLGVQFAKVFVERVYNNTKNTCALQNSLVIREYPISVKTKYRSNKTKFIDLLYLDLDENDEVVIGVENKFLTQDSENQLEDYRKTLETLYADFDVKIVYLTLDGRASIHYNNKGDIICLSWTNDILAMLLLSTEIKIDNKVQNIMLKYLIQEWKARKETKNHINRNIRDLIHILIEIREIRLNKPFEIRKKDKNDKQKQPNSKKIKEFILDRLKGAHLHMLEDNIQVTYIGKCYKLHHKPTKTEVFIPVTKNTNQFVHMVKIFCTMLVDDKIKKEILISETILTLDEATITENGIVNYFDKKRFKR